VLVDPRSKRVSQCHRRLICKVLPVAIFLCVAWSGVAENINFGPLRGTLGVQAGLEYTDNLNNSQSNRVSNIDWLFGPTFNGGIRLPIHFAGTGGEELTINTGLSYSERYSLNGNRHTRSFSSPVTADIYIPVAFGNWRLTIGDSFTFKNDVLEEAVALNQSTTERYQNTLNANLTRSFGKAALTLSGSRTDTISPTDPDLDQTVYQVSFTPSFLIREYYSIFWENSYAWNYLADPDLQDSEGWSSSIGVSGQITPSLNGVMSVGFAHSHIKSAVVGPGDGIFGGVFDPVVKKSDNVDGITSSAALSYSHPLNPNTSYSVSAFNSPGVTAVLKNSSITEVYGMGLIVTHRLTPKVTLSPAFRWTHMEAAGRDNSGQKTDLFSVQLSLQRVISQRILMGLSYIYVSRYSNQPGSTYDVNRLTLKMNYTF